MIVLWSLWFLENRFLDAGDKSECYEFPITNEGCSDDGCDRSEAKNLCKNLGGAMANPKSTDNSMVRT